MEHGEAKAVAEAMFATFDVPVTEPTLNLWGDQLAHGLDFDEALAAIGDLSAEWTPSGGRRMPTQAELRDRVRMRRRALEGPMAGASSWTRKHVCPACKGAGWLDKTADQAERDGKKLSSMAVTKCYVCNGTGKGNELEEPPTNREDALERIAVLRGALSGGVVTHIDDVKPPEEHRVRPDGGCDHAGCAFHRTSSSASEPTS